MTELENVKNTLGTLILLIAQSSNSPISIHEAERLLQMLEKGGK